MSLSLTVLTKNHDVSFFDCEEDSLNTYLKKHALSSQQSHGTRTYVAVKENKVLGYFSLSFGAVSCTEAPQRIKAGLGHYPIPILLLARLAVDQTAKGKGVGKALLKQALLKALHASEIAGLRAVVVHALNDEAISFYTKYGFVSSLLDDRHLFLLIKDIQKNFS